LLRRANAEGVSDVQRVVVDANVLLSFIVDRNEKQRAVARALLLLAEEGNLVAIVPQFVVFEVVYVLQSTYRIPSDEVKPMMRDLISLPGVLVIDECPWKRVMDFWPSPFPSIADAAIVAIAANNRYDAVATFDQKLSRRLKDFDIPAYW
jgi:predicted nucleic acid-binding protein